MNAEDILKLVSKCLDEAPENRVDEAVAIEPSLVGMRMFDSALVGVASASDEWFGRLRDPVVVGPHMCAPEDWLPGAASVVSVFFSFTDEVVRSNAVPGDPSPQWLHARIEGQTFLDLAMRRLVAELQGAGGDAVAPSIDPRFVSKRGSATSNWSERHVAHVCGLGTCGLCAGLITEKGMAGRLGSVVTSLELVPTERRYTEPFEWCNRCGACIARCPSGAVSERGKDHGVCIAHLDEMRKRYAPRYGCGKCQTRVPCERGVPRARRSE